MYLVPSTYVLKYYQYMCSSAFSVHLTFVCVQAYVQVKFYYCGFSSLCKCCFTEQSRCWLNI